MRFWKLGELKDELRADLLGEPEALPYLLWYGAAATAVTAMALGPYTFWDYIVVAAETAGFVGGTVYLYRCNRGAQGKHFFIRFFSLGWVFGIRFLVMVTLPAILLTLFVEDAILGGIPDDTTLLEACVSLSLTLGYYLRLSVHFQELAGVDSAA